LGRAHFTGGSAYASRILMFRGGIVKLTKTWVIEPEEIALDSSREHAMSAIKLGWMPSTCSARRCMTNLAISDTSGV